MTLYDGPERRDPSLTEDRVRLMIAEAVQRRWRPMSRT